MKGFDTGFQSIITGFRTTVFKAVIKKFLKLQYYMMPCTLQPTHISIFSQSVEIIIRVRKKCSKTDLRRLFFLLCFIFYLFFVKCLFFFDQAFLTAKGLKG